MVSRSPFDGDATRDQCSTVASVKCPGVSVVVPATTVDDAKSMRVEGVSVGGTDCVFEDCSKS